MATTFELRTTRKSGFATLFVRVQSSPLHVNVRQSTQMKVPVQKWRLSHDSMAFQRFVSSDFGIQLFSKLNEIARQINIRLLAGIAVTSNDVKDIIGTVVLDPNYRAIKERGYVAFERKDLNGYIRDYIAEMENGTRQSASGKNYAKGSVTSMKQAMRQLQYYQQDTGLTLDFKDIDMLFYQKYTSYLKGKNYSINSIGKCINALKTILQTAQSEGFNKFEKYRDQRFKAVSVNVDTIYLTEQELKRFTQVRLSGSRRSLETARDIFLIGVYTAQRFSDYSGISRQNIKTHTSKSANGEEIQFTTIELHQKKTGAKVSIPVSTPLKAILEKYRYNVPKMSHVKINEYIKEIGRLARINDQVEIKQTKGGFEKKVVFRKYELICTHTARRTGATLMYLAGIDIYDIMKITGHSTPAMLKRYIRADELEVAEKIIRKYDYFN